MLRTKVGLGLLQIEVEAENVEKLIREVTYIRDLDRAREGEQKAYPFYRKTKEGYVYVGFRRLSDGAEVKFGHFLRPDDEDHRFFAHGKLSEGYKGWEVYDRDGNGSGHAEPAATGNGQAKPAATPPAAPQADPPAKAGKRSKENLWKALTHPLIKDNEKEAAKKEYNDTTLTEARAQALITRLVTLATERTIEHDLKKDPDDLPF